MSGFNWPLTTYVRHYESGARSYGVADLTRAGAYIETAEPVEVRR